MVWPGVQRSMASAHRDRHLLESAVARPFQTAFGRYIHRGVIRRGAALFHSLIADHPFGDGNKRTAVIALQHFLLANGLLLLAGQEDMYQLALKTASSGERDIGQEELLKEIVEVLESRTMPISELSDSPPTVGLYTQASRLKRHIRAQPLNRRDDEEQRRA